MLNLFYVEMTASHQGNKNNDSFKLIIESYSKNSAVAKAISYLYLQGFHNVAVAKCQIATSENIKSYFEYLNITLH
ncbi:hypothetical protein V8T06_001236 [Providencia rettgeri]|nr:hypothetical protein [Providencia rettgeri]